MQNKHSHKISPNRELHASLLKCPHSITSLKLLFTSQTQWSWKHSWHQLRASWNLLGPSHNVRKLYMCRASGAVGSQVGEPTQQLCVWMRSEGTGQRACKKLMTSKLSKAILGKKGKGVIKMNSALVCQVDGQKHTEKHWGQGANIPTQSSKTLPLKTAISAQNWFYTCNILHIFPMSFSWRETVFTPYPLQIQSLIFLA